MTDIAHYLHTQGQLIESYLDQLVPLQDGPHHHLFAAARYSLLGGGKRLRPILVLATTQILQGDVKAALTPACVLEIIHTYSLIHDDLPCMDDDDYRRGKLTLHKQYTEGHAVLTGDYLLTYAFEVLANAGHLSPTKKIKMISTLAKRIGSNGMVGGQAMDLALEGQKISLETLRMLHQKKTAELLVAALEFGGIISDAEEEHLERLRQFGENIGMAFQIIDDMLDVTSSQEKHGCVIASDVTNAKSTYATLLGLKDSQDYAEEFYNKALQALQGLPFDYSLLIGLANFILQRKH